MGVGLRNGGDVSEIACGWTVRPLGNSVGVAISRRRYTLFNGIFLPIPARYPGVGKSQLHYLSAAHCATPVTFGSELPSKHNCIHSKKKQPPQRERWG